jgi:hypothetical protein
MKEAAEMYITDGQNVFNSVPNRFRFFHLFMNVLCGAILSIRNMTLSCQLLNLLVVCMHLNAEVRYSP